MASFQYLAIDNKGKLQKGVLEAETAKQARQALREKNLIPTEVKPYDNRKTTFEFKASSSFSLSSFKDFFTRRSLSNKDVTLITRQLATLFNAGLPIAEYAITGILWFAKGLHHAAADRQAGHFDHRAYRPLLLEGKTLCVVGVGGIGRRLAGLDCTEDHRHHGRVRQSEVQRGAPDRGSVRGADGLDAARAFDDLRGCGRIVEGGSGDRPGGQDS